MQSHIIASAVCPNFPKTVSNRLLKLPLVNMESDPNRNIGRSDLSSELGFVTAPRETDPTPAVIRPGAGPASAMVTRSQAREGRGTNVEPETEFRPEMNIPAEIPITCEGGLGAARPSATDIASRYITADTPEVTVTVIGQEITTTFPPSYPKPLLLTHTRLKSLDLTSRTGPVSNPGLYADQASEHVFSLAVAHATAMPSRQRLDG